MENSTYLRLFEGKRILIVEDEYFLADDTRRKLEKLGAVVAGPTGSVRDALDLMNAFPIDGAILDVHLGDEFVFPVAEELERRDISFVFATSYDPSIIPVKFTGFALCEKPTELEKIAAALFAKDADRKLN